MHFSLSSCNSSNNIIIQHSCSAKCQLGVRERCLYIPMVQTRRNLEFSIIALLIWSTIFLLCVEIIFMYIAFNASVFQYDSSPSLFLCATMNSIIILFLFFFLLLSCLLIYVECFCCLFSPHFMAIVLASITICPYIYSPISSPFILSNQHFHTLFKHALLLLHVQSFLHSIRNKYK